jgi:hypothetical protein
MLKIPTSGVCWKKPVVFKILREGIKSNASHLVLALKKSGISLFICGINISLHLNLKCKEGLTSRRCRLYQISEI